LIYALLAAVIGVWTVAVPAIYYRQVWHMLAGSRWDAWAAAMTQLGPALPFWGQAVQQAASGVGGALLLLVTATVLGLGISHVLRWSYNSWMERLPFAASLGIGAFACIGLALAVIGWYRQYVLVSLVLLVGVMAALRDRDSTQRTIRPQAPHGMTRLWMACTALGLGFGFVAAFAPWSRHEALLSTLAYPQRYLATGLLVAAPQEPGALYPTLTNVWFGYGLALASPSAVILLNGGFLLLAAVLTFALAQRYAPAASPWLAVALAVTAPTTIWMVSTANTDLALMLFVMLASYALLRYGETLRAQWLLLAGANLGWALGITHLGLSALALLCTWLVLLLARQRTGWRKAIKAGCVLGCISVLVALPWHLHCCLPTGTSWLQLWPAVSGAAAGGWALASETGLHASLNSLWHPPALLDILSLPWDATMLAYRYGGALGLLLLALLPLVLLRRLPGALPWLLGLAAAWLLLWPAPVANYELPRVMPILPILAVLAAAAFARGAALARMTMGRRGPALAALVLAGLMIVSVPPFALLSAGELAGWGKWLSMDRQALPVEVVKAAQAPRN
jgi:hypothetical protein